MITKERGEEEEEDDEGDKVQDGCDEVGGGELCLTEVVLVVRGRRIRVDRYTIFQVCLMPIQPRLLSFYQFQSCFYSPSTGPG